MCVSTLFHVLQKQNISLYAFVPTKAALVKKKGRRILTILRPFPAAQKRDLQEPSLVREHVAKRLSSLQANVEGTAAVLKKTSLRGFFGVRDCGG